MCFHDISAKGIWRIDYGHENVMGTGKVSFIFHNIYRRVPILWIFKVWVNDWERKTKYSITQNIIPLVPKYVFIITDVVSPFFKQMIIEYVPTLTQVMPCCLATLSHYLTQLASIPMHFQWIWARYAAKKQHLNFFSRFYVSARGCDDFVWPILAKVTHMLVS